MSRLELPDSIIPFEAPLVSAILEKRYKRFLADCRLGDGQIVTAHCANSGSMLGLAEPGATIYLSKNTNPKAKLDWRWELVEADGTLVGINTSRPNRYVETWINQGHIAELAGYETLRREVKYGDASRIDLLLGDSKKPDCYVEIKNVTLASDGLALFPDAKTARGTKHLGELANMAKAGARAVMFYLVHRGDCRRFGLADDIDPAYAAAFQVARDAGVEMMAYSAMVSPNGVSLGSPVEID